MKFFLSKYLNKIDGKGRVSIPASYRSVLAHENSGGVIVYPSFKNPCIEACSFATLEKIVQIIQNLDPYSPERDAFEAVILGEATQLPLDNEGRVILPGTLLEQVGITQQACFIGKGDVFEIWDPEVLENYLQSARQVAKDNRMLLKNISSIAGLKG
jgi:MraZ protein